MDDSGNQLAATLEARLSPRGREVAEEIDRGADSSEPPSEELLHKLDALSNGDREILARLLGFKAQGARTAMREAGAEEGNMERLQLAMYRAAELEGLDPGTLTVAEALDILDKHGEG
jgi:hypothetical protein